MPPSAAQAIMLVLRISMVNVSVLEDAMPLEWQTIGYVAEPEHNQQQKLSQTDTKTVRKPPPC
jgi:hypothetical protein